MPTTVSRTEMTLGPFVPDSRKGKAFFLSSAPENSLCFPLSGGASFEPGDLLALPELVLFILGALQGRDEGGAAQSDQAEGKVFPALDGCLL